MTFEDDYLKIIWKLPKKDQRHLTNLIEDLLIHKQKVKDAWERYKKNSWDYDVTQAEKIFEKELGLE